MFPEGCWRGKGRAAHSPAAQGPSSASVTMARVRRALSTVALAVVLVAVPAVRAATAPLSVRLAQALAVPGYSKPTSAAVAVDVSTGRMVFARNPDLPLAPASNEKLTVTYAALHDLGATYRFRTEVFARGHQDGATWYGDVFLKGFGDPTLTSLQLERLAAQIAELGITHIAGRVLGDESWLDQRRAAPDWPARFFINECAPLSALVVDRAFYDHHVALQPALAAAGRLRQLLRAHGVSSGAVGLGRAPTGSLALAQVESDPLPEVLREMDRESDNFAAELLLKVLGAESGAGGTTAAGAAVVLRDLAAAGVPLGGVRIVDGSGLSYGDRLTARALAQLLLTIWNDPELHDTVWAALPVAGVNGTLEDRMQRRPARGAVRAKTGTTSRASALAGYVRDRFAFAVLQNGRPVATRSARVAQDRFATALASAP
jgi:D-alanyl-D-alanine carboxypeptidase/D-alanyl-D-alanine-endopeptidase (penicillin-binding protein 4)